MALDFQLQQPYIPVCLMTSVTAGTVYFNELDLFRRFRDDVLLEAGFFGKLLVDSYYTIGSYVAVFCEKHPAWKKLLLNLWFKPLHKLFKLFGW